MTRPSIFGLNDDWIGSCQDPSWTWTSGSRDVEMALGLDRVEIHPHTAPVTIHGLSLFASPATVQGYYLDPTWIHRCEPATEVSIVALSIVTGTSRDTRWQRHSFLECRQVPPIPLGISGSTVGASVVGVLPINHRSTAARTPAASTMRAGFLGNLVSFLRQSNASCLADLTSARMNNNPPAPHAVALTVRNTTT